MSGGPQLADRAVRIGDRRFTLRFSVRAMAALQDHWQLSSFKAVGDRMAALGDNLGMDDLVGILWAGMRTHHPEMTKDDVLDLVDAAGMSGLVEAMTAALSASLPETDGGDGAAGENPPTRRAKSGRSPAS